MFPEKTGKLFIKNKILVVPLDWGLGHATRCIPLIRELIRQDCEVIIAAEKATKSLLKHEFQQLNFIDLPGYRVTYSNNRRWLPFKLMLQFPSIIKAVYREQRWLKNVVKKFGVTAIISDNRLGLFHNTIRSVYITHQLLIKTGSSFTDKIAQLIHYSFIKKYSECWVPDYEGKQNIAGALSHPVKKPGQVKYIGCLSRFEKKHTTIPKKDALLILISGPEPQRTLFENTILQQLAGYQGNVLLVRGLPAGGNPIQSSVVASLGKNLLIKDHLDAANLNVAMESAEWVISRSGYTTIMDLLKLGKKAILVPTPGQTEQEYLAQHQSDLRYFYAGKQEDFNLMESIQKAAGLQFELPALDMDLYRVYVQHFLQSLPKPQTDPPIL